MPEINSSKTRKENCATPLWKALLLEHRLPWRVKETGLVYYFFLRHWYRLMLRFGLRSSKKPDITVIIGLKNRFDEKIKNALKSIRNQDYNQNLIKILVVDYDSKKEIIPKLKKLCNKYGAKHIRANHKPVWNRGHCLNVGIKRAKTKYILTSDTDIIFEKNYIKEAVEELEKNPYQVVLSRCLNLPNIKINELDIYKLKKLAKNRDTAKFALGINLTLTYYYHKMHGYDEKYELWGYEDNDLIRRFLRIGLNINVIKNKSFYLHQWHPPGYCAKDKGKILENLRYFESNNCIIRNRDEWGKE